MWLFDIFKSRKRKHLENLESVLVIYTEILDMIKNKREKTANGKILDFDFLNSERDKMLIIGYHRNGVLSPLDPGTRQKVVNVFLNDCGDVNYIDDLETAYLQVEILVKTINHEIIRTKYLKSR